MDAKSISSRKNMVSIISALVQEMWLRTVWKTYGVLLFVSVTVAQEQTLYPRFVEEYKRAALLLPKNTPPGTAIFRFRVDDNNRNTPLTFGITGQSHEYFKIQNVSTYDANLILVRPLTQNGDIQLNASVEDSIKQRTSIPFRIIPTNANYATDHVFLDANRTLSYTIAENSPKSTEVGCVLVRSNERPGNTRAPTLELEPDCNTFCVDRVLAYTREDKKINRGCIRLVSELDYEKQSVYYVTLAALNGYQETSQDERNIVSISVIIVVEDVQDTPPVFINLPSVIHLPSNSMVGKSILNVHAEDGDVKNQRSISYSLERGPESEYFQINSNSGELIITSDAAAISEALNNNHAVLHIKAEERGEPRENSSTVKDVVVFFDSEENQAPVFAREAYEAQVPEHAAIFSQIQISESTEITDADQGVAGVFTLRLADEIEGHMVDRILEIQPPAIVRKGAFQIRVKNSDMLDYERFHELTFKIIAEEVSEHPKTSSVLMTLTIEDINDNAPKFTANPYYAKIPEDAKAGHVVVQISATDDDSGKFGKVTYTRIIGELSDMLNLDPQSGLITVGTSSHNLDREIQDEYTFEIEASDEGNPPNTNTTKLILIIADVNDEKPKFRENIYQKDLAPDDVSTCPEAILKVEAIDADKADSSNSMVEYEIRSGDRGVFKIDRDTGQICVQKWPLPSQNQQALLNDGDPKYNYNLEVRAYDKGVPTQESIVNVNINIMKNPEYLNATILYIYKDSLSNVERDKNRIEKFLTRLNGANTIIRDVAPYEDNSLLIQRRSIPERTLITTFVRYPKQTLVDLEMIANELNITAATTEKASTDTESNYVAAGWKVGLITLLVLLAIILLMLLCFCCYRQSRNLDARKVKPIEDKPADRSQVIEVATLEQGLSAKANIRDDKGQGGTRIAPKLSHKNRSMSDEEMLLTNGGSKRHVQPSVTRDDRRMSAGAHLGTADTRQPHVSYSRHFHGQHSQSSKDVTGNSKGYQEDEVDEVVEEMNESYAPASKNSRPHVAPDWQKTQYGNRLGRELRDNYDDEIEEIIVIEPDARMAGQRGTGVPVRRVRRIIKRSPARTGPSLAGGEDGEWVPMQLPDWLGKVPPAEYVEEYEGDESMGGTLGNARGQRARRKTGQGATEGGRSILVRKYKDGGESLPGDRLVLREGPRVSRHSRDINEEDFLDDLERGQVRLTRHQSRERPRHRPRERGRALTRASFRVEEDSEDDLIDLEAIPDDKSNSFREEEGNKRRGRGRVRDRRELKEDAPAGTERRREDAAEETERRREDAAEETERGREDVETARSLGEETMDDGEADAEDEYEKEALRRRRRQKKLTKWKKQLEREVDEKSDVEEPLEHEHHVASQATETDSKFTQTQLRAESGRKELELVQDKDATVDARDEFEFTMSSGVARKEPEARGEEGSNASVLQSADTLHGSITNTNNNSHYNSANSDAKTVNSSVNNANSSANNSNNNNSLNNDNYDHGNNAEILPKHELNSKTKNKPNKANKSKKGESRYMDWYNKNGDDKGTAKHKAHCEKAQQQQQQQNNGGHETHKSHEDETLADETKASKRRGSDPMANGRPAPHRRAGHPGEARSGDAALNAMDNEMRLGGNRFVGEEDEDSGIGHTDTFKNSKNKQFIEKRSLFTIAYNGMQNKQDALKDRETSASANNRDS